MKQEEHITAEIQRLNPAIPADRAQQKAADTGKGVLFVIIGVVLILLGFGLAIAVLVLTKASLNIAMAILCGAPALPGAYFLLAGGFLISRDAMQAAENSGGVITRNVARALKLVNRKPEGQP